MYYSLHTHCMYYSFNDDAESLSDQPKAAASPFGPCGESERILVQGRREACDIVRDR